MKPKTALLIILLAAVCLTASGCFYLRLQQVKAQLSRFDEYYKICEGERFSITAKEPVLLSADVIRIMDTPPSKTHLKDQKLSFDYILEKQYPPDQGEPNNYDITITFDFNEDKLSEVLIDRKFFAAIPKWMLIDLIKAFADAKVDLQKRYLSASYHSESPDVHIPDVNEVLTLLGKPYTQDGNIFTYEYKRLTSQPASDQKDNSLSAVFTFDKQGRLVKCRSEILGGHMELDLAPLAQSQEQTPAADGNSVKLSDTQK
jgi:hypothetical protein